jgi:hypothetical protein
MEGDKEGKVCPSKWQFGSCDSVEDDCPTFSNCSSCTMHSFCGWCSSANKCLGGHQEGPANDECTFWDYQTCRNRHLPTSKKTAKGSTKTFGWRGRYGERICRTSNAEITSVEQTGALPLVAAGYEWCFPFLADVDQAHLSLLSHVLF